MLPKNEADTADTSRKTLFGAAGSWRGIDDRRPKSWIGIIRGPRLMQRSNARRAKLCFQTPVKSTFRPLFERQECQKEWKFAPKNNRFPGTKGDYDDVLG